MKPEELLQTLRDAGMDDEAIKGLLEEAMAALNPAPAEEEKAEEEVTAEEKEEKKFNDFYGF